MRKIFYQEVDLRNRKEMTEFLSGHFRYDTMNSWNRSTSYANNMKVYKLGLTSSEEDSIYAVMRTEDFCYCINGLLEDFDLRHDHNYVTGFNGRSNGYIVLYVGTGKCGINYRSYPGKSIDMYEDFTDWTMDELRDRVRLIQDFDKLCDAVVDEALEIAQKYKVEDEEYTVVKTRKVLIER